MYEDITVQELIIFLAKTGIAKSGIKSTPAASKTSTTSSKANTKTTEEISRLEALCETRTKELNYAKIQLKQGAAGFQAMTVLVQYLSHEV